jgi:hypothetical protein
MTTSHSHPDQRHMAAANMFRHRVIEQARVAAVKRAVAQDHACGFDGGGDDILEITDRIECVAKFLRRIRIEWMGLGFDRAAHARIRPAAEALRHEKLNLRIARSGEQIVRRFGPQTIGVCKGAIEGPHIHRSQIGHLVDHDIRPGQSHGRVDRPGIQGIDHEGLGAKAANGLDLAWRARHPHDRMARRHQEGNEAASDGAGGTCNKNAHRNIVNNCCVI